MVQNFSYMLILRVKSCFLIPEARAVLEGCYWLGPGGQDARRCLCFGSLGCFTLCKVLSRPMPTSRAHPAVLLALGLPKYTYCKANRNKSYSSRAPHLLL